MNEEEFVSSTEKEIMSPKQQIVRQWIAVLRQPGLQLAKGYYADNWGNHCVIGHGLRLTQEETFSRVGHWNTQIGAWLRDTGLTFIHDSEFCDQTTDFSLSSYLPWLNDTGMPPAELADILAATVWEAE